MSARRLVAHVHARHFMALSVREWGLPNWMHIGRAWRSEGSGSHRLTVVVPAGPGDVRAEVADVVFVDGHVRETFPAGWRAAFAHHVRRSPFTCEDVAAWAGLSDRERIHLALRVLDCDQPGKRRDKIGEHGRRRVAAAILGAP